MDTRTDHDEEIAEDRELIGRSRALIKVTERFIATGIDQLTEILKLIALPTKRPPRNKLIPVDPV